MNQTHIAKAVLWMCGTLVSFSVMALSIRALSRTMNTFEILAARSAFGVLVFIGLAALQPQLRRQIRLREFRLHAMRNGVSFASQVGWVYSLTVLPLATVTALEFTAPAWAAALAVLFLRERITPARILTVMMGVIGVLIILRPGALPLEPGIFVMVAVAAGFAIGYIITKKLTGTETTFAILFWMNVMQFPLCLLGVDPTFLTRIDSAQLWPLLGVSIPGITAHLCMTNAFRAGDAQVVVPLDFLRLPLIAVLGWIFYAERADVLLFVGAAFIITGILVNLRSEARRSRVDTTLPSR
ncbi:MAG: DMT family transporter [Rhizobiales bacterium]|nr:DMT family transporter [Hyphomicrobiales bacterium]